MSMIDQKYQQLGGTTGFLGSPKGPEQSAPDGTGRFRHYQHGSSYWHPSTGAHEVHGAIREKWSQLGWERSFLGYPKTDETATPDRQGRYNHFQGGSIYWHPFTGAHEVHGAILAKWAKLGWERSFLGYPQIDETATPDGKGRYNHFQGGSIYWHPDHGAFEVHGAIRDKWASLGWEKSVFGYPTSDEVDAPDRKGRQSNFQRGFIYWHPELRAFPVPGNMQLRDYDPAYGCQYWGNWWSKWDSPTGWYSSDLVIEAPVTFGASVQAVGRYNDGTLSGIVQGVANLSGQLTALRFSGRWDRTRGHSGGPVQYGRFFLDLTYAYPSGGCNLYGRWTYGDDDPMATGYWWQGGMK